MRKVWKVGSRWSDWGDPKESILAVFKNYNVVFTYTKQILDVNPEDLVALADGYTIISIGKIISYPQKIKAMDIVFSEDDKKKSFYDNAVCGCRIKFYCWFDLETNLYYWLNRETTAGPITYSKRGQFCHAVALEAEINDLFNTHTGDDK